MTGPPAPRANRKPRRPEPGSLKSSVSIRGIAKKTGSHTSGRQGLLMRMPMRKTTKSPEWRCVKRPALMRAILFSQLDTDTLQYWGVLLSKSRRNFAHLTAGRGHGGPCGHHQVLPSGETASRRRADLRDPGPLRRLACAAAEAHPGTHWHRRAQR